MDAHTVEITIKVLSQGDTGAAGADDQHRQGGTSLRRVGQRSRKGSRLEEGVHLVDQLLDVERTLPA